MLKAAMSPMASMSRGDARRVMGVPRESRRMVARFPSTSLRQAAGWRADCFPDRTKTNQNACLAEARGEGGRWCMKAVPLLVLILAFGAVGCDESPTGPTIVNVTWKLETVARVGTATITIPNPDQFTVRFEDNSNLTARADCNSCSGRYTLDG